MSAKRVIHQYERLNALYPNTPQQGLWRQPFRRKTGKSARTLVIYLLAFAATHHGAKIRSVDLVLFLSCSTWPPIADSWIHRKRHCNWPFRRNDSSHSFKRMPYRTKITRAKQNGGHWIPILIFRSRIYFIQNTNVRSKKVFHSIQSINQMYHLPAWK